MGIVNTILTRFKTAGAGEVARDTDNITRSQTRLGQASAGAGRQFSAQSKGLGGLVGAYAGAAATSFALEAAFTGLSRSAQSLQTLEGLNSLAAGAGIASSNLLASVQEITKGQMTLTESAQQMNLALSAGFGQNQIEGLADVALRASRALGRDLNDAFTRVVRGSAKMETELLDELGIYTKIGPATRAYAMSLGVSVNSLTEFQRRQAFVNAVISEGERKFSAINTTVPTTAETVERFISTISTAITSLGGMLANIIAPFLNFMTNNLGATFGAIGTALSLAFSKGFAVAKDSIKNFESNIESVVSRVQEKILGSTNKALREAYGKAQGAVQSINLSGGGTAGIQKQLSALRELSKTQKLTTAEMSEAVKVLKIREANLLNNIDVTKKKIVTETDLQKTLNKNSSEYAKSAEAVTKYTKSLANADTALAATRAQMDTVNAALNTKGSTFVKVAGAVTRTTLETTAALGRFAVNGVSFLSWGIGAASMLGMVASGMANLLGRSDALNAAISTLGQSISSALGGTRARELRTAVQGIVAGSLESLEETDSALRNIDDFKFKDKFLGIEVEITKTKEDIVNEVSTMLASATRTEGFSNWEQVGLTIGGGIGGAAIGALSGALSGYILGGGIPVLSWGTAIAGGLIGAIGAAFASSNDVVAIADVSDEIVTIFGSRLASMSDISAEATNNALRALQTVQNQFGEAALYDPGAAAMLHTYQELILESASYLDNITAIQQVMRATGQSAAQIVQEYEFAVDNARRVITTNIGDVPITFTIVNLDEQIMQFRDSLRTAMDLNSNGGIAFMERLTSEFSLPMAGVSGTDLRNALEAGDIDAARSALETMNRVLQESSRRSIDVEAAIARINDELGTLRGISESGLTDLTNNFVTAATSINDMQAAGLRSVEMLRQIQNGVQDASLSFEQYEQLMSNAGRTLLETGEQLNNFNDAVIALEAIRTDSRVPQATRDAITAMLAQGQLVKDNINAQRDLLETLEQQRDRYRAILELNTAIASFAGNNSNQYELQVGALAAASGNDTGSTLLFLRQVIEETRAAAAEQENLRTALENIGAPAEVVSRALLATTDTARASLVDYINKYTTLHSEILATGELSIRNSNGVTAAMQLTTQQTADMAQQFQEAADAMDNLFSEAAVAQIGTMRSEIEALTSSVRDSVEAIASINRDEIVLQARFELDTLSLEQELARIQQEQVLENLRLQVELVNAQVDSRAIRPEEGALRENALQQQILAERRVMVDLEYQQALETLNARRQILAEEAAATVDEILAREAIQIAEIENTRAEINAFAELYHNYLQSQSTVNNSLVTGFLAAGQSVATGIVQALNAGGTALSAAIASGVAGTASTASASAPTLQAVPQAEAVLDTFNQTLEVYNNQTTAAIQGIRDRSQAEIDAEGRRLNRELSRTNQEELIADARHQNAITNLTTEGLIEDENAQSRLRNAREEGAALDDLTGRIRDMQSSFESSISSALMGLNDLIFYGEGSIEEVIGSLFRSIQETVFEKTIAEPIANWLSQKLTTWISDAVGGVDIMGNPLTNDVGRDANGALLPVNNSGITSAASSTGMQIEQATTTLITSIQNMGSRISQAVTGVGSSAQTAGSQAGGQIQTSGTTVGTAIQTTGTSVGTAAQSASSTMMNSLLMLLPLLLLMGLMKRGGGSGSNHTGTTVSVTNYSGSAMQAAQGGIVHMAQGGSMLRDRVNAKLEPGEFVIRKPSAQRLGVSALQRMNATGKAPAGGAPIINFNNEGTPKSGETGEVKFDGDKYVIDVIMRDLDNNGPIRRSLRGGKV